MCPCKMCLMQLAPYALELGHKYNMREPTLIMEQFLHYWRKPHWYQHVSAGQQAAGTNVPKQYPAGMLVPARHPSRH